MQAKVNTHKSLLEKLMNLFLNFFKSEPTVKEHLEKSCTAFVEEHLMKGKTFIRVSDLYHMFGGYFPYGVLREELLQDDRVFPKYDQPNILKLDPTSGTE